MKVLHIINNLGSGGAEKLIEDMLPLANEEKNIQVDLLLLTDKGNVFGKNLKNKGVNINIIDLRSPRNPLNIFYIRKYILNGRYDIVHTHLFPTLYWTSIASKLVFKNKPKFIHTEHSTHNRRRDKKYLRLIEKYIYSSYDKIISISKGTQNNLISWLESKDKEKFCVINNGIDLKRFISAKPYNKSEINNLFTKETKLLCMVGSFSEQKDQATIIKALSYLEDNIHLVLVGEGPLLEKNKELSKMLNLQNRVHYLGFRDDVERIFKTSDIVIISSHWEGFGLVAAEGMATGKPVIASDVDGLREVVYGAGILFELGNYKELSKKILNLLENEDKYKRVSAKCLKRSAKYDINIMADEYLKVYIE